MSVSRWKHQVCLGHLKKRMLLPLVHANFYGLLQSFGFVFLTELSSTTEISPSLHYILAGTKELKCVNESGASGEVSSFPGSQSRSVPIFPFSYSYIIVFPCQLFQRTQRNIFVYLLLYPCNFSVRQDKTVKQW